MSDDILKGIQAIAAFIGESERTAFRRCHAEIIPAYKWGGGWRMSKAAYLDELSKKIRKAS